MAKKKTMHSLDGDAGGDSTGATAKKRHRRSPEEMIGDLQDEIKKLKAKAAAKALKQSPAIKLTLTAIRNIDKGLDAAAKENDSHLRHALADARKHIAVFLDSQGVKLPKARLPKGPRPRTE